ncbi:MAG: response regulator [Candidatus Pacebacteria bacterium]|nr:response regulator [Candidatus Paceibacterota bacterium]
MMEEDVKKKKILLVEDDPFIADIYITYLKKEGFEVAYAKDGAECLSKINDHGEEFDLLVLDLLLPNIDGFEVLKRIKEKNINISVVALSNLSGKEDIERALSLGAKDYFIKTKFRPKEIVEKLKNYL